MHHLKARMKGVKSKESAKQGTPRNNANNPTGAVKLLTFTPDALGVNENTNAKLIKSGVELPNKSEGYIKKIEEELFSLGLENQSLRKRLEKEITTKNLNQSEEISNLRRIIADLDHSNKDFLIEKFPEPKKEETDKKNFDYLEEEARYISIINEKDELIARLKEEKYQSDSRIMSLNAKAKGDELALDQMHKTIESLKEQMESRHITLLDQLERKNAEVIKLQYLAAGRQEALQLQEALLQVALVVTEKAELDKQLEVYMRKNQVLTMELEDLKAEKDQLAITYARSVNEASAYKKQLDIQNQKLIAFEEKSRRLDALELENSSYQTALGESEKIRIAQQNKIKSILSELEQSKADNENLLAKFYSKTIVNVAPSHLEFSTEALTSLLEVSISNQQELSDSRKDIAELKEILSKGVGEEITKFIQSSDFSSNPGLAALILRKQVEEAAKDMADEKNIERLQLQLQLSREREFICARKLDTLGVEVDRLRRSFLESELYLEDQVNEVGSLRRKVETLEEEKDNISREMGKVCEEKEKTACDLEMARAMHSGAMKELSSAKDEIEKLEKIKDKLNAFDASTIAQFQAQQTTFSQAMNALLDTLASKS